jgi:hypothetical protein
VKIGNETRRVEMRNNAGSITLPEGAQYEIDPQGWLLMQLLSFSTGK